jgi:hypothetical protein
MSCTYCDREDYLPGYINPAMCERHYEMAMMISYLKKHEISLTTANIQEVYEEFCVYGMMALTPVELSGYLESMTNELV